jgi:NADPH:quinone reductase-like Zn-dependent oxidoreductase
MRSAGVQLISGQVQVFDLSEPRPLANDEVLIAVRAAGIGNWDETVRTGGWDVGMHPPMALGVECAGTITDVGRAVTSVVPGDDVLTHPLPLREQGAWAEYVIAPVDLLAKKPRAASWEVAGAFPVPALTAEQVLSEGLELQSRSTILVHGAGGVTGGMLVQLAVLRGAQVIATSGSSSADRVRALGATDVLDYNDPDWPREVCQRTAGTGVAAAANAVRGGAPMALRAVAEGGRLATITSDPPRPERGIVVSNIYVRPDGCQLRELARLLGDGLVTIRIGQTCSLDEAEEGLEAVVDGKARGAVVITL